MADAAFKKEKNKIFFMKTCWADLWRPFLRNDISSSYRMFVNQRKSMNDKNKMNPQSDLLKQLQHPADGSDPEVVCENRWEKQTTEIVSQFNRTPIYWSRYKRVFHLIKLKTSSSFVVKKTKKPTNKNEISNQHPCHVMNERYIQLLSCGFTSVSVA